MKNAHTPKSASALEPRRYSTASAPRSDISKAVADIRAACERFEASSDGEAMDLVLIGPGDELGFPLHKAAAAQFFEG